MAIPEKYRGVAYGGVEYDTRTHYVSWNGDLRERGDRWNGNTEWEDQGFHSRGVHTVEGTNPVPNLKPGNRPSAVTPMGPISYSPFGPQPRKAPIEDPQITKANRARR